MVAAASDRANTVYPPKLSQNRTIKGHLIPKDIDKMNLKDLVELGHSQTLKTTYFQQITVAVNKRSVYDRRTMHCVVENDC